MTLPPPPSAESVPPSAGASPASAAAMALLAGLVRHGVTDLVLSPGSRSQALALAAAALARAGQLHLHAGNAGARVVGRRRRGRTAPFVDDGAARARAWSRRLV